MSHKNSDISLDMVKTKSKWLPWPSQPRRSARTLTCLLNIKALIYERETPSNLCTFKQEWSRTAQRGRGTVWCVPPTNTLPQSLPWTCCKQRSKTLSKFILTYYHHQSQILLDPSRMSILPYNKPTKHTLSSGWFPRTIPPDPLQD